MRIIIRRDKKKGCNFVKRRKIISVNELIFTIPGSEAVLSKTIYKSS